MTAGWDPDLDLESGVLRNVLGISDPDALARVEAELSALALTELALIPLPGDYDLAHLRAFHRRIFQEIYPFAGEIRAVAMGRAGQLFCPPQEIRPRVEAVFVRLAARDHLRGLGREEFLDALTELYGVLNFIHPHREGNGRTQRAFLAQLARDAGHRLTWTAMDRAENTAASRAANVGDLAPLRAMLDTLLLT